MRLKTLAMGTFLALGGSIVGFVSARGASGVADHKPMTYSGILTNSAGAPLNGSRNIQILFWNADQGGEQVCFVPSTSQTLIAGAFQVELPDECSTAVHANPNVWTEVFIDGESLGRSKLGAVPFALEADHADKASHAAGDLATVLTRLTAGKIGAHDTSGKPLRICSGTTPIGNTSWKPHEDSDIPAKTDITVDVDIKKCEFAEAPILLSALNGTRNHRRAIGGSNAYLITKSGFKIYVYSPWGITPENANNWNWHIEWIALGR